MSTRHILSVISVIAFLASANDSAFALAGGPFGNDTTSNTTAGTYNLVGRGPNTLVVSVFGGADNSEKSGRWAAFQNGFSYFGFTDAIVDTKSSVVAGIFVGELTAIEKPSDGSGSTVQNANASAGGSFDTKITSEQPILIFSGDGMFTGLSDGFTVTSEDTNPPTVDIRVVGTQVVVTLIPNPGPRGQKYLATAGFTPLAVRGLRSSLLGPVGLTASTNAGAVRFGSGAVGGTR